MGLTPQLKQHDVFSHKSGKLLRKCPYEKHKHIQSHSGVGTQRQTDYTFISILYFTSFTAVLNPFESCAYLACSTHSVVLYTGFCIWHYGFYVKSHRIYFSLYLCGCQLLTIQFSILSTSVCPAFLLASSI